MPVKIRPNSRLRFGNYGTIDGIEFWDQIEYPTVVEQPDDLQHTVLQPDRLDTIARQYYGDPVLKWIIALVNDIEIEPTELNTGSLLRIPSPRYVRERLFLGARY